MMSTATLRVRLGPADHGRELTYDEFLAGDYVRGHNYELIEGRLYVSPAANYSHDWIRDHLDDVLRAYMSLDPMSCSEFHRTRECSCLESQRLRV